MIVITYYITIKMQRVKTDMKFDPVQTWTDTVGYSHSNCESTAAHYRAYFNRFCEFIGKSATEILSEYEESTDRDFKRKYAQFLRGWIGSLMREGYASKTIVLYVAAVQSFFKYSDLPLGHVPKGQAHVTFHNRDITKQEITDILSISKPREKAFFTIMAQSGLRPQAICKLRIKHLQPDLKEKRIPCKIEVPMELAKGKHRAYFTFIGEEAVKYLVNYLKTRTDLDLDSYVFTQRESEEPTDYSNLSHRFRDAILKLRKKGILSFEQKQIGKPSELRLYNLRKYFRKYANQAGFEFVQFWMGHIVKEGQEESYRPKDVEFHRDLYAKKAMPFLRIEKQTPSETESQIEELRKQLHEKDRSFKELKESQLKLKPFLDFLDGFDSPENFQRFMEILKGEFIVKSLEGKGAIHKMDFTPELEKRLERVAKLEGKPVSEIIREGVAKEVSKVQKEQKQKDQGDKK